MPQGAGEVDRDPPVEGLTAEGVTEEVIEFVLSAGRIKQSREARPEWDDREFKYILKLPLAGLPKGLFVEVVMDDPDPDVPTVRIVSCHK